MRSAHTIRLEFASVFEMVDVVQVVSDHIGRMMGLDDDGLHWLGVAVRESVINAIKHGNANDARKRVHVEVAPLEARIPAGRLDSRPRRRPWLRPRLPARSAGAGEPPQDQRAGHLPDPQLHGRDARAARRRGRDGSGDGQARRPPLWPDAAACASPDPLYLATATEIVLKAGAIQMARRGTGFRVDKKSTIDLVTEVDLECERMCRAMVAERFPDHDVLGEELSPDAQAAGCIAVPLGVRPAGRHHQLRARAADLLLVAGARDRRPRRGGGDLRPDARRAVHGRARRGRVPERGSA